MQLLCFCAILPRVILLSFNSGAFIPRLFIFQLLDIAMTLRSFEKRDEEMLASLFRGQRAVFTIPSKIHEWSEGVDKINVSCTD